MRYVWATGEARAALGDPPTNMHPPATPELEDFVEYVQKLRRAGARGEPMQVRMRARQVSAWPASCSPSSANADPQPDIARYLADGTLERHLGFEVD